MKQLILVLVYMADADAASWMTPAEANRYTAAHEGLCEVIEPFDKNYEAVAKLAGDPPARFAVETGAKW